ncbi:hypothetical protein ScPMuIL_008879 [Solemya velum]
MPVGTGKTINYIPFARPLSAYHEKCIPKNSKKSQKSLEQEGEKCDVVTEDTIWRQIVKSENQCISDWWQNWGSQTELTQKGRSKNSQELPEGTFSTKVPNATSANYGFRIDSSFSQQVQTMEFRYFSHNRRRRLGNDLVCY